METRLASGVQLGYGHKQGYGPEPVMTLILSYPAAAFQLTHAMLLPPNKRLPGEGCSGLHPFPSGAPPQAH